MIQESEFQAAWWLPGGHLQTLWPALLRPRLLLPRSRERLELPDGDFLDLDWIDSDNEGPVVLILHGLEGSIESPYAQGMSRTLRDGGYRVVVMHFRGCSGEPNRLARAYHSGETEDLAFVLATLRQRFPDAPLAAVGYSLGGNVMLKYLGETGAASELSCAAGVCVPFQLSPLADRLNRGFSRIYQQRFVSSLKQKFLSKFENGDGPIDLAALGAVRTLREFDDQVTAPLHGFDSAEDYYTRCSCRQFLKGIEVPTLIIHARNDPFMVPEVVPSAKDLADSVTLELARSGGHVGFLSGVVPGRPRYWLEERVPHFLSAALDK